MARRAAVVAALVKHLELPVRTILDAGCGLGLMRPTLLKAFRGVRYTGIEVSEHLCKRYGWTQASLAAYRPRGRFDLILCYDVLQYLSDRDAVRALANLGRLCRGALYFHVPTQRGLAGNADARAATATFICAMQIGIAAAWTAISATPALACTSAAVCRSPSGSWRSRIRNRIARKKHRVLLSVRVRTARTDRDRHCRPSGRSACR